MMKKILEVIACLFVFGIISSVSAQDNTQAVPISTENIQITTSSGEVVPLSAEGVTITTSNGGTTATGTVANTPENILKEAKKLKYIYFYGKGCSHCIDLDKYFDSISAYSIFDIEKKEVWGDRNNAAEMSKVAAELGISKYGTPFVIVESKNGKKALSGTDQVERYFDYVLGKSDVKPIFTQSDTNAQAGGNEGVVSANANSRKTLVLISIAVIALVLSVLFIQLSRKK